MKPDQPPPAPKEPSNPPSPASSTAAPATRPKLNLQKRTVPDAVLSPAAATESKASPFGGAKPIDSAAREREVEERRQLAHRQKKDVDEKSKAEKAEKQRQAKEQAKSEKTAPDGNPKDTVDTPQGGKNFEILRRAGEDGNDMTADQEPEEQRGQAAPAAEAEGAKEAVPDSNGAWRNGPSQSPDAAEDEGWSTVGSRQRSSNRRGQSGRA